MKIAHDLIDRDRKTSRASATATAVPPSPGSATTWAATPTTWLEVFDDIRRGTSLDRSQFYKDITTLFYGFREDVANNQGRRDGFWPQEMADGIEGEYDCTREFSAIDYADD